MIDIEISKTAIARLTQANRLIEGQLRALFTPVGLHVGQEYLLFKLAQYGTLSMAKLIETLDMKPPTLTKMIERLVSQGLVEKFLDEQDGRKANVRLSEKGKIIAIQALEAYGALNSRIEDILGEGDTKSLRKTLKKLLKSI